MGSLGPAFNYSPSTSSRSSPTNLKAVHAPKPSLSSTRSLASSSNRSSYTSYTSSYCSYRDTEAEEEEGEEDEDDRSILEDLLENLSNPRASNALENPSSPPRIPTTRDSSQQLRERTRYRSSASIQPLASTSNSSTSMDLSAFLASLPPSLDKCFCGQEVEEDSIYCSRLCAQEDALNALCGASSGAEDSDRASLVSGSSGSAASQSGESHYRRVEREEVRREKERQAKLARERAVARRRAREGESVSSAGSTGSKKGSLWRSNVDVGSLKTHSPSASTSTSSNHRAGTPSLSSSVSSLASTSSASSPISPSFPPPRSTSHQVPQISPPVILAPPRPTTPSPPSPLRDVSDIYSSYLATTPLAPSTSSDSKLLRTPRQNDGSTPRSAYPQTPYDEEEEEDVEDDSPTGRAARFRNGQQQQQQPGCGVSDVGLRMLELCSSYPSSPSEDLLSESLDQVQTGTPSLGWGHREMQERMNRKQGRNGAGHTKGKLSFEDVVGILGA
ncbi:hypothetical protein JCM3765_006902 [Sporobolomyces pararoseus]